MWKDSIMEVIVNNEKEESLISIVLLEDLTESVDRLNNTLIELCEKINPVLTRIYEHVPIVHKKSKFSSPLLGSINKQVHRINDFSLLLNDVIRRVEL